MGSTSGECSGHVDPRRKCSAEFRQLGRPGPIHMLNLVRSRSRTASSDGTEASGKDAYRAHARGSGSVIVRIGGRQVWGSDGPYSC